MGEKEDKEKAEKLAAAKKRVAQLQKKKKAAGGGEKAGAASKKKDASKNTDQNEAEESPLSPTKADESEEAVVEAPVEPEASKPADEDADEAAFNDAIKSAKKQRNDNEDDEAEREDSISPPQPSPSPSGKPGHPKRQPSISMQSKMRSASFRQGATPTSPSAEEGGDITDIYRKQITRIEELEKENKRLAQEAEEARARWHRNEEELEELREKATESGAVSDDRDEVQKLRTEIDTLRRSSRQSVSLPKSAASEDVTALKKEVESKEATVSDMQLEISRLRSQVSALTSEGQNENEQIAALQDSLSRSEASKMKLESELSDVKKSLSRATEKSLQDGTHKTSQDTKIKNLERELDEAKNTGKDATTRRENLEKKIEAMNKLHREAEQRHGPKLAQIDSMSRELALVKARLEAAEKDNLKLRESRKSRMSGDGAREELEELEEEDRARLEKRIRDLEGENFDLRRGVWRDQRKSMQPNLSTDMNHAEDGFDEVDLNGSGGSTRKSSSMHPPPQSLQRHSGFAQVLNSGLAAFRANTTSPDGQAQRHQVGRPRNDSLLEEFDDDAFDEAAFAQAQREEEMKKMVEHVREVKRGLKKWQGWRLDLVDLRRSQGVQPGFGEIFEA